MRLGRRITRGLRDGATLVVAREWQVRFTAQGRGIIITGEQVSVLVEAPAVLEPLAAIERERSTASMFPIMLSGDGVLLAAGAAIEQSDLDAAVQEAKTIIAKSGDKPSRQAERLSYLAQLQSASGSLLEQMPQDLFFPQKMAMHSVRPVNLPDGSTGEFEYTYQARCAPGHIWLEQAEREIITRIGSDERHASEVWTLSEA